MKSFKYGFYEICIAFPLSSNQINGRQNHQMPEIIVLSKILKMKNDITTEGQQQNKSKRTIWSDIK